MHKKKLLATQTHYLFNFFVQLQLQSRQVGVHQRLKINIKIIIPGDMADSTLKCCLKLNNRNNDVRSMRICDNTSGYIMHTQI